METYFWETISTVFSKVFCILSIFSFKNLIK